MKTSACLFALLATLIPAANAIAAEAYPARPIRMIIPAGTGGVTDILGRVIAQKLSDTLGQQVIVDNRPGASGMVGSQIVAKATPDGYTLHMVFPSQPVNPSLYRDIPYDTVHRELVKIVRSPEFARILTREGATPVGNTPAEFDAVIRADVAKWAKVIKESGIKAE